MGSKMEGTSAPAIRRDPYEVLCVTRDSTDQEIKTAYRKLALKYVLLLANFQSIYIFVLYDFLFNLIVVFSIKCSVCSES